MGLALACAACAASQSAQPDTARLPPPATPPEPLAMEPGRALGLWQSSFGAVKIEADTYQPDGRLMGVWLYDRAGQEVIGFFRGPLRGNVFEFTWHEPSQPQDLVGAGFLVFEPDGSRFTGTWWTRDQSRTGDWSGWRPGSVHGAQPANPSYGSEQGAPPPPAY